MQTKIQAAQKCVDSGIQTLIVNGRDKTVFEQLAKGCSPGTLFKPNKSLDNARDNWLRHTLKVKGTIEIDHGAQQALLEKGASLLPSGIIKVNGRFLSGEAVNITYKDKAIAKGIVLYSATDLTSIKGLNSQKIEATLGYSSGETVIHRDDLVLL
jgi:glutamate 5-kinase